MWLILPSRKYLFNNTYKVLQGYDTLQDYYMLVFFVKTQFLIWIQESEPAGIWTISGYTYYWATLNYVGNFYFFEKPRIQKNHSYTTKLLEVKLSIWSSFAPLPCNGLYFLQMAANLKLICSDD